MSKIENKILKSELVDWNLIKDLQPNNLKNPINLNYLKESLVKNGFSKAFDVWQSPEGEIYFVDGHTRGDVLKELVSDGYEIPNELMCNFLDCKDRKEAVKILLEVHNQKQNKINDQAMNDWVKVEEIDIAEISVESLNVDFVDQGNTKESEAEEDGFKVGDTNQVKTDIVLGDLFEIGEHRLLCGDSTDSDQVEKLMNGEKAELAHNDPPYGMKKEKDGVLNDNLNYGDLLEFNRQWIPLQFTHLKDNGSFYCWGIDEPLMDIYSEILKPYIKEQKATFRNLITWDKGNGQGQNSENTRSYAIADEKCLFLMCGVQGFNNNADNYFEGWEPVRDYLLGERKKAGWDVPTMKRIAGHSDLSRDHWTSKSQFNLPTEKVYKSFQDYCQNHNIKAFEKEYEELKKEYYSTRAYFNNVHDNFNNVWKFERHVRQGNEGDHATPKPIPLCERVIKSSCPESGLVIDMFLGSGSTMVASHQLKRKCYGMELDPKYCQVIIDRMKKLDPDLAIKKNGTII